MYYLNSSSSATGHWELINFRSLLNALKTDTYVSVNAYMHGHMDRRCRNTNLQNVVNLCRVPVAL